MGQDKVLTHFFILKLCTHCDALSYAIKNPGVWKEEVAAQRNQTHVSHGKSIYK
jgi:hypothetical protein